MTFRQKISTTAKIKDTQQCSSWEQGGREHREGRSLSLIKEHVLCQPGPDIAWNHSKFLRQSSSILQGQRAAATQLGLPLAGQQKCKATGKEERGKLGPVYKWLKSQQQISVGLIPKPPDVPPDVTVRNQREVNRQTGISGQNKQNSNSRFPNFHFAGVCEYTHTPE